MTLHLHTVVQRTLGTCVPPKHCQMRKMLQEKPTISAWERRALEKIEANCDLLVT